MKIKLTALNLREALSQVSKIVSKGSHNPILTHVLLEVENGFVDFTGKNESMQKTVKIECNTDSEYFAVAIEFTKLYNLCKSLQDEKIVTISIEDEKAKLSCGKSKITLSTLPATDFPSFEIGEMKDIEVSVEEILTGIDYVASSAGKDHPRRCVNSVVLASDGVTFDVVATSGAKLSVYSIKHTMPPMSIIIPIKSVGAVKDGLLSCSSVGYCDNSIVIKGDNSVLYVSVLDEKFVQYKAAIPTGEVKHKLTFSKESIVDSLGRISIIADDPKTSRCSIDSKAGVSDAIIVGKLLSGSGNQITESFPIDNESEHDLSVSYNPQYLLDSINKMAEEKVTCSIYGDKKIIVLKSGNFTSVITQVLI